MILHNIHEILLIGDKSSKSRKFLEYFIQWLEDWDTRSDNTGKLTKETYLPLHHTRNALLEITEYCFSELSVIMYFWVNFKPTVLKLDLDSTDNL